MSAEDRLVAIGEYTVLLVAGLGVGFALGYGLGALGLLLGIIAFFLILIRVVLI